MKNNSWVIVDTETDGLQSPIHVVEVAAQLMHSWDPVGSAFQMLLDHDVPISPRVVAVHGYSREHLRRHGHSPARVYRAFRDYVGDYPLVAHNLSFDWDRCLFPEWARLDIHPIGRRGFCSLIMARRLALETNRLRLDDLKDRFALSVSRSHLIVESGPGQASGPPKLCQGGVDTSQGRRPWKTACPHLPPLPGGPQIPAVEILPGFQ